MRRFLVATAATALGALLTVPAALAAESINSGSWNGSALSAGPTSVSVSHYQLSGTFRRNMDRQVEVSVAASPAGSGACEVRPVTYTPASTPRAFGATLSFPCNGTYTLVASAVTTENNNFFPRESATLDRTVTIAAPPPRVSGVTATSAGRSIKVTWDDLRPSTPDLTGYIVERKVGSGDFTEVATVSASTRSFTDDDLPPSGGSATYRVSATRPVPGGSVSSQSSEEATAGFDPSPTTTSSTTGGGTTNGTTGGSGGGSGGGTDGGGGTSATGGSTWGGASGGSKSTARASGVTAPRVASAGAFLPPLLRPTPESVRPTPTTVDGGFTEALPYERREPGDDEPVLPDEELASAFSEEAPRRGMAIPVATALVLAVWAFHLRTLARAARPLD